MMRKESGERAVFVEAGPFWGTTLRLLRASAITMPWRRIYIIGRRIDDQTLRRHEMVHIEQIERDGVLVFCAKYVWWSIRYGYWRNPYEVEAYDREHDIRIDASQRTKRRR